MCRRCINRPGRRYGIAKKKKGNPFPSKNHAAMRAGHWRKESVTPPADEMVDGGGGVCAHRTIAKPIIMYRVNGASPAAVERYYTLTNK